MHELGLQIFGKFSWSCVKTYLMDNTLVPREDLGRQVDSIANYMRKKSHWQTNFGFGKAGVKVKGHHNIEGAGSAWAKLASGGKL